MDATLIAAAWTLVMAGLAGGCAQSQSVVSGAPGEGVTQDRIARDQRWLDEEGYLRLRTVWMVSEAAAQVLLEQERAKTNPDEAPGLFSIPACGPSKEYLEGLFCREFILPSDWRMRGRHEALIRRPGPPLAGKFDNNVLHWLDVEAKCAAPWWLDYRSRLFPDSDVSGGPGEMGFAQQDVTARLQSAYAPVMAGPVVRYRRLDFFSRPRLPDTGERFPRRLENLQAGLTFPWLLPPGIWNVTFGSAGDRLFDSGDEVTADITWAIGALGYIDSILIYVNWQNNRDWQNRRPIPGVAYRYKQGNWFTLVAGFPDAAVAWRPNEKLELAASYSFPRTLSAEVAYRPCQKLRLYAGFDWSNQRYFRHDRAATRDRLWYVDKRLSAGVRWNINEHFFVDAFGGYAFDRFWFEGETYEDRGFNRIDVKDGPFLGVRLGVRF